MIVCRSLLDLLSRSIPLAWCMGVCNTGIDHSPFFTFTSDDNLGKFMSYSWNGICSCYCIIEIVRSECQSWNHQDHNAWMARGRLKIEFDLFLMCAYCCHWSTTWVGIFRIIYLSLDLSFVVTKLPVVPESKKANDDIGGTTSVIFYLSHWKYYLMSQIFMLAPIAASWRAAEHILESCFILDCWLSGYMGAIESNITCIIEVEFFCCICSWSGCIHRFYVVGSILLWTLFAVFKMIIISWNWVIL